MQNLDKLKALANELPDTVKANALALIEEMGTVVEGIGDEQVAWRPGYLRLVQGTTDRSTIPKGTGIGEFVLGEKKVEQPLHFIPLRIWDARQMWDPDQTSNKILCWSPDSKLGSVYGDCRTCKYKDWVEGQGSDCGKTKTTIVIDSTLSRVFTITFGKSNFKVGSELEGAMKKAAVPTYQRTYGLTSATNSTAKNVENFKLEILDDKLRKTPDSYYAFLKELFDLISSDRKAMLDTFYENAKIRKEQLALSGNAPAAALEDSSSSTVSVEVNDAAVSEMAKGYVV